MMERPAIPNSQEFLSLLFRVLGFLQPSTLPQALSRICWNAPFLDLPTIVGKPKYLSLSDSFPTPLISFSLTFVSFWFTLWKWRISEGSPFDQSSFHTSAKPAASSAGFLLLLSGTLDCHLQREFFFLRVSTKRMWENVSDVRAFCSKFDALDFPFFLLFPNESGKTFSRQNEEVGGDGQPLPQTSRRHKKLWKIPHSIWPHTLLKWHIA